MTERALAAVELFAGAGGMALGTARAGFEHIALLEQNQHAVETLRLNESRGRAPHTELPIQPTDVREFDYLAIAGPVDLLAGGAPCQPFSLGGKHQGRHDERNLFPEVFRAQRALWPRAVLLENVRGLARPGFRPYLEYILLQLALPGLQIGECEPWEAHKVRLLEERERGTYSSGHLYHVTAALRECADFGVPQRRARLFMVAVRSDLAGPMPIPKGHHSREHLQHDQLISGSYWKRHGLDPLEERNGCELVSEGGSQPWRTVRDALAEIPAPHEGSANGFHPNHVGVPGARSYPGHTGSPWDEPAKTLKAGVHGVPGGENMLRDDDGTVRYFTVHESAVLQGFPREYQFTGSRTEAMRQIGNAAPPPVCRSIAEEIKRHLSSPSSVRAPGSNGAHVDLIGERQLALF
jgi:DNA (cytosine-5)-methyltransferase 1